MSGTWRPHPPGLGYWDVGPMDWPMVQNWVCEICGSGRKHLVWGLAHGLCRCGVCHMRYKMVNDDGQVLTPICALKSEFFDIVKAAWLSQRIPMEELRVEGVRL